MTATRPEAPDPRERSNLIAGAIVLLLLLAGVVVAVVAMTGGFGGRDGTLLSVYLPGVPQVPRSTEVMYQGRYVGEVERTDPPRIGLQLMVTAGVVPEVTEVVTLFPGDSIRLAEPSAPAPVVIGMASPVEVVIRSGTGVHRLQRDAANTWVVDWSRSSGLLTVNGGLLTPRAPHRIQTGDLLAFGRVRVEWQDVQEVSRLTVRIELGKLRKAAGLPDTASATYLLGPRSSVALTSTFGLGKPAIRLEPAFGRTPFALQPDSVIAASPSVDLERTVQGMLTYLNSPAALRREPATRFERIVSDLNRGLEQVATVGGQVDDLLRRANAVAAEQGGRGMVGRLVLEPRTLDTLHAVANRLSVMTVPLADTTRSILARLKLDSLESGVTAAVGSARETLRRVDTSLLRVTALADSLQPVIKIVKDSLPPAIGRVNGLLDQGSGAAKAAKVVVPAALLSGIAAAIVGTIKMLGIF
jgi:ABC-type transporter Mla subunit MlaD